MKQYDVLFLSNRAIGNTIQMLYAVEYCLKNGVKVALYIDNPNKEFKEYLQKCYGKEVILDNLNDICVENLVHTFIFEKKVNLKYKNYIYINPDKLSTKYQSETEQYLSIARALYPSSYNSHLLEYLIGNETEKVKSLEVENKYVIYPGCSSFAAVRRWPYYKEFIEYVGEENVIIIGGKDDLNDEYSYIYRQFIAKIAPYQLTNRKIFWDFNKKFGLLKPYVQNKELLKFKNAFFNVFKWEELVAIFKKTNYFVGNDGGLMHLASASGAKGVAIFGPTSVNKSKSYSPYIKEIYKNYDCQPCHFGANGKVFINNYFISCPYDVKCLKDITVEDVIKILHTKGLYDEI